MRQRSEDNGEGNSETKKRRGTFRTTIKERKKKKFGRNGPRTKRKEEKHNDHHSTWLK